MWNQPLCVIKIAAYNPKSKLKLKINNQQLNIGVYVRLFEWLQNSI